MVGCFVWLVNINKSRLTNKVFRWDYDRIWSGTWCHEIKANIIWCNLLEYCEILSGQRPVNITAIRLIISSGWNKKHFGMYHTICWNLAITIGSNSHLLYQHIYGKVSPGRNHQQWPNFIVTIYLLKLKLDSIAIYHMNKDYVQVLMLLKTKCISLWNVNDIMRVEQI